MRASVWRVYLNVFDDNGNYTGFQEVSEDVELDSLGTIDFALDNTDYNIGIYRNSNFSITFRNDSGKYSDVGQPTSIFRYTRTNSLLKITWQGNDKPLLSGFFKAGGEVLCPEIEVFQGFLSDKDLTMDMLTQELAFTVLGKETVLSAATVPFGSLTIGDTISSIIYASLNQTSITDVLTVDPANINVGIDTATDAIADLENKTVWDALQDLLLISNSVLYIKNEAIIVAPRTVDSSLAYTFYGQSSILGPENIQDLQNIQNGIARTFNYLYWGPSNETVQNSASVAKYGATTKEFTQTYITNTTNQAAILNDILDEFGLPKQEFDLYTPLNYSTIQLFLLNQIQIDFPPQYLVPPLGLPICGLAICGECETPSAIWSFTENPSNSYKVEGTSIDPQTDLMCISVRRV